MEWINYGLIADTHAHTIASGHAYSSLKEMAYAASKNGLEVLSLTEHAPQMPGSCQEIYFRNFNVIPREMHGVKLLLGTGAQHYESERRSGSFRISLPKSGHCDRIDSFSMLWT